MYKRDDLAGVLPGTPFGGRLFLQRITSDMRIMANLFSSGPAIGSSPESNTSHMTYRYFQASSDHMSGFVSPEKPCDLCGTVGSCFELWAATCPELPEQARESSVGCVKCLASGRFAFDHNTEIGALDQAVLEQPYASHRAAPENFRESALAELRRTPQFHTWQGETWLTHCNDFMAYMGTWQPEDFYKNSPVDDGRSLFFDMTEQDTHLWDESVREGEPRLRSWDASYYVFKCLHCEKLRGNWDCR